MNDLRDLEAFADQVTALEARIAAAEAAGDDVPAEARMMLTSLRELARAVDGLRTTMHDDPAGGVTRPPTTEEE